MGGFGGMNPFPVRFGSGPSEAQKVYRALRGALGGDDARTMGPAGGIDDLTRRVRARVIGASASAVERAFRQAFAQFATEQLDQWANRLGVPLEATTVATRAAVLREKRRKNRSDLPSLEAWIATLSPYLGIKTTAWLEAKTTVPGLTLKQDSLVTFIAGREGSSWPNYSSRYLIRITWDVASSGLASPGAELRQVIRESLNLSLPSWVNWKIVQLTGPFYLDGGPDGTSRLDLTPMR